MLLCGFYNAFPLWCTVCHRHPWLLLFLFRDYVDRLWHFFQFFPHRSEPQCYEVFILQNLWEDWYLIWVLHFVLQFFWLSSKCSNQFRLNWVAQLTVYYVLIVFILVIFLLEFCFYLSEAIFKFTVLLEDADLKWAEVTKLRRSMRFTATWEGLLSWRCWLYTLCFPRLLQQFEQLCRNC